MKSSHWIRNLSSVVLVLTFLAVSTAFAKTHKHCTYFVAGKDATADGSVLMGYNNDWDARNALVVRVVPAAPDGSTYRYVRIVTALEGETPEGGLNEHQLGFLFGAATTVKQEVSDADPFLDSGYGAELWDMILQKSRTAREAIDMLEQMANTKGFSDWAAGSMAVADPNEAWDIELLGGHHWVAERIPDNAYLVQPNVLRLKQIDLSKRNKFRGSPDLVQFAISLGIYDPSQGPFDLASVYNEPDDLTEYYNTNRMWRVMTKFNPSMALDPTMPYDTRPLFVVPEHKLMRFDFMAINRDHYEHSALDETLDYALMDPHNQDDRPICYHDTDYAAVWQLRRWMPDAIGGVVWLAPSHPCSSTFVPFYAGITDLSTLWSDPVAQTAFKTFHAVSKNLDKDGAIDGDNRYQHFIPLVKSTYGAFEADEAQTQSGVERTAWGLWLWSPTKASEFLTKYSEWRADQAVGIAKSLRALTKEP